MAVIFWLFTVTLSAFSFIAANAAIPDPGFSVLYAQGDPGPGIGGYDLASAADKSFGLDFSSTGKQDHIVLYRPGAGAIFILNPARQAVVSVIDPGSGFGGFDLSSPADLAFAFDFGHTGNLDHIVFYRPGTGLITIVHAATGTAVFTSQTGIGGYDLKSPSDIGLAFDYGSTGKQNHLVFYRPGVGTIYILTHNADNSFSAVYVGSTGIGGFDLMSPVDRLFTLDYGDGHADHLALYRPGTGIISIVALESDNSFSAVFTSTTGIGGYDLLGVGDLAFGYDYDGIGTPNYIALYRPGTGAFWIAQQNAPGSFAPVYAQGDPGSGIAGYDLASPGDRAYAFDAQSLGLLNGIALYRPGTGAFWIAVHAPCYTPAFENLDASIEANDFIGFILTDTVDECLTSCTGDCNFVNVYHDNDASNKDDSTMLTCAFYASCHTAAEATNSGGQSSSDGGVTTISSSAGYCLQGC
ncbi:hypothetical protein DFH09DRAFT_1032714 [Mycena vulgaris]|nr:hypothetical protein DFH09DRAFT_1032714 [Mycena vulgaris]